MNGKKIVVCLWVFYFVCLLVAAVNVNDLFSFYHVDGYSCTKADSSGVQVCTDLIRKHHFSIGDPNYGLTEIQHYFFLIFISLIPVSILILLEAYITASVMSIFFLGIIWFLIELTFHFSLW